MTLEKIYSELMDLYNTSGKEFFIEVSAFLADCLPGKEHTILGRSEEDGWKLVSSTILDADETEFLRRSAGKEYKNNGKEFFCFTSQRQGISSHMAVPLSIRRRGTAGLWIIESRAGEKLNPDKSIWRIGQMMAFFLQVSQDERMRIFNRYLDAGTGLPGRMYFRQVVGRIQEQGYQVILCGFRWDKYREGVRLKGSEEMEERVRQLVSRVASLELGNMYALSEDTIAVISIAERQEVYARMESILEEEGMGSVIKAVMMRLEQKQEILTEMEELFSMCSPGIIWYRMQEKESVFAPFLKAASPQKEEGSAEINEAGADGKEDLMEEFFRSL